MSVVPQFCDHHNVLAFATFKKKNMSKKGGGERENRHVYNCLERGLCKNEKHNNVADELHSKLSETFVFAVPNPVAV